MKSDRKQTILFIIILLVLSMGIGYAFLTTTLSIDGISDIDSSSWDVHFDNVQVQSGSVTGSQVTTPATISADGQTVSYHIKLNEPGDHYTFKIDVVNDGSLDAIIDNILFQINGVDATMAPDYLAYYFMYDGYYPVSIGNILNSGQTKTLIVGVQYRQDINPDDLPTDDESLNISLGFVYSQKGKVSYLYSTGNANFWVGESIPDGLLTYNTYQDAINNYGHSMFFRYSLINDRVVGSALGFVYNSNVYYLVGNDYGMAFDDNKTIMNSVFGSTNCSQLYSEYYDEYQCSINNIRIWVRSNGNLSYTENGSGVQYICSMSNNSNYECEELAT